MLVDKDHGNIFPLLCEVLESVLDRRGFGLGVYHEEISLPVWPVCDMLCSGGVCINIGLVVLAGVASYPDSGEEETCY